jgi:glycine/D-amino acid oxidase-like deaminating enzyme
LEQKQEVDFIIVGQGLAGTLLSYFLMLENQRVVVLDYPHAGRTTSIAAGLINPVTGRRIAKSWRFEALAAFAKQTYQRLEEQLNIPLWLEWSIVRALHNNFEVNEWLRRSAFPEFSNYLQDGPDPQNFDERLRQPFGWGELRGCAQVALPALVEKWRVRLQQQNTYFIEDFDYDQLTTVGEKVVYKAWSARKIVFCEGARAVANPFFKDLPFLPTKGELMLVKIPGPAFGKIVKHNIFLIPLGGDLYWAGATSRYEYEGASPSAYGKQWLTDELGKSLKVPFEVVSHEAGIRPTVSDVRPFLGVHHDHPSVGIFNGLGTKGALLAPFFAKQLTDFLLGNGKLDEEVDIVRFERKELKGHFFTKQD